MGIADVGLSTGQMTHLSCVRDVRRPQIPFSECVVWVVIARCVCRCRGHRYLWIPRQL